MTQETSQIKEMLYRGQIEKACRSYIDTCQKYKVDKLIDLEEMTLEAAHLIIHSMIALRLTDVPFQETTIETGSIVIYIKRKATEQQPRYLYVVKERRC